MAKANSKEEHDQRLSTEERIFLIQGRTPLANKTIFYRFP